MERVSTQRSRAIEARATQDAGATASSSAIALACPFCRGALAHAADQPQCIQCGRTFQLQGGIIILAVENDSRDYEQTRYFDEEVDAEFEIERPHGLPGFYGWLLNEKFRRGVMALDLREANVLVVCGGSGMDAEFLTRAGARVVTTDLSFGAASRALERGRRHETAFETIVADAQRLPFGDRSFDIVYVHDGLHHINDPIAGLREMARVARVAVSVSEPARATVTALAASVGISQNVEEAGNPVRRLTLAEVQRTLEREGFRIACARRYAMFYRHHPGPLMRALSQPTLFPLARSVYSIASRPLAPFGNKLVVTAVRA
jgi:SAM-dependent methyltransferase